MCIIQSMLQHYIKEIIDANPLKPKVMKLTYMGKKININGTTIHLALGIPLNKKYNELKALKW